MACSDTEIGKKLKTRILESYQRVKAYKEENHDKLNQSVSASDKLIRDVGNFMYDHSASFPMKRKELCTDDKGFKALKDKIEKLGLVSYQEVLGKVDCKHSQKFTGPVNRELERNIYDVKKAVKAD